MPNENTKLATKGDLAELYQRIYPYLGNAAAGFTPIGTIIAVFGETAPANYLICDGTAYNKADYPELAAHLLALTDPTPYEVIGDNTKFKVPDLRGEFLRGTGTNSHAQMGNGAAVGVHQDASGVRDYWIRPNGSSFHLRMSEQDYQQAISSGYPPLVWPKDSLATSFTKFRDLVINGTLDPQGTNPGDYNTMVYVRPTNTSVLFCIATKNITMGGGGGGEVSGGCGSLFRISTVLTSLLGTEIVISDGTESITAAFDNEGFCEVAVPMIGDLTITYANTLPNKTVHVDYYKLFKITATIENLTNVSYDTAYDLADALVSAGILTLAGTQAIFKNNGFNDWYSSSSNILALGENNGTMTVNGNQGVTSLFNGAVEMNNVGDGSTVTFKRDGYIIKSQHNDGSTMVEMKNHGDIFNFMEVSANDSMEFIQHQGPNNTWITFYPKI